MVGIITFHRAINYGAVLQVYALQKSIEKMDINVKVLDYVSESMKSEYDPFIRSKNMPFFLKLLYLPLRVSRINKFKLFIDRHINITKPLETADDLIGLNKEFSAFITGSDQVWNYIYTNFDKAFFLDFADTSTKKYSYAASFGFSEIPDNLQDEYYDLLKDFDRILVREWQGANIVKNLLKADPDKVLDPTLLLDKFEWSKLKNTSNPIENGYILLYGLIDLSELKNFAEKLSEKTGLKIIWTRAFVEQKIKNCVKKYTSGPEEWLTLFLNASYIVTNSFHGTAFAINFNKNFFTGYLPPPAKNNSRLENILEMFNLQNRLIIDGDNTDMLKDIDYTEVNKILENEREKSLNHLKMMVKQCDS